MDDWIHGLMESLKSNNPGRLPKECGRPACSMQSPKLAGEPPAPLSVAGYCRGFNPFIHESNLRLSAFASLR
jgi:hypothetical protein